MNIPRVTEISKSRTAVAALNIPEGDMCKQLAGACKVAAIAIKETVFGEDGALQALLLSYVPPKLGPIIFLRSNKTGVRIAILRC